MRLCEELVSPALSESPHIERLADAQHSARRGSQQLVLPATPPPLLPHLPDKRTNAEWDGEGERGAMRSKRTPFTRGEPWRSGMRQRQA